METAPGMTADTILKFLAGQRAAIEQIANARGAVWLGLLFVISAGFAREYDAEDLRAEPWHLLLPLAASLVTSFLLYCLVALLGWRHHCQNEGFWRTYVRFLSLYWMTAPLAWLYAVPVERFLSARDAVIANFIFLGIVSVWRVALMIRSVSVLFGAGIIGPIFSVMLMADSVMLVMLSVIPRPIVAIMGGINLNEAEREISIVTGNTTLFSTLTLPIWVWGYLYCLSKITPNWSLLERTASSDTRVRRSAWCLAATGIALLMLLLPWTQSEQQRRRVAEELLRGEQTSAALRYMSQFDQTDFPPLWEPPPLVTYRNPKPSLINVLDAMTTEPTATWLADIYVKRYLANPVEEAGEDGYSELPQDPSVTREQALEVLTRVEQSVVMAAETRTLLGNYMARERDDQAALRAAQERYRSR